MIQLLSEEAQKGGDSSVLDLSRSIIDKYPISPISSVVVVSYSS